jgi:hypothetical protein
VTEQPEQQDYLTTEEVAARYRTTPGTVHYWRHVGYGPKGVKLGARVLYPRENVEAFDAELKAGNCGAPTRSGRVGKLSARARKLARQDQAGLDAPVAAAS